MALQYPGRPNIPQYESPLASFMPGYDAGRKQLTDNTAFDAAAKAFGGGSGASAAAPKSAIERLMGLLNGGADVPAKGPYTRPETAVAAIDTAAPTPSRVAPPTSPQPGDQIATMGGPTIPQGYLASARAAESGGNDAARNPNSTATGRYQFLESTWNGLAQQYPNLGLTPDGRTDPAQQERAMAQFTQDNARALSGSGVPVNPGTLYAAHFLGAGGAQKALTADPSTPMSALVDPGVIQSNPHLQGMTAGDFAQWAQRKGGNQSGGYQPPMQDVGAGAGKAFDVDEGTMRALLASEETRPLAVSLIQARQETQASQGRFVTEQGDDGSIWQRDTLTGEQKVIREAPQPAKAPEAPSSVREYEYAKANGYTGSFTEWQTANKAAGVNVTVDNGGSNDFYKTIDQESAKAISGLIDAGTVALGNSARIGQLETELSNAPQGAAGKLTQIAGSLGIPMEGVDELQAAQAIINQLVPGQRAPGSGTMSDADLALFKQSLPSIANQPGGNQKILQTMKAINEYVIEQGRIANQIANRELTPAEGRAQLMAIPNPLAGIQATPTAEPAAAAETPQIAPATTLPTATNPETGERIQWNGTEWVPAQ